MKTDSSTHRPPIAGDILHNENITYFPRETNFAGILRKNYACRHCSFIVVVNAGLSTDDLNLVTDEVFGIYPEDKHLTLANRRIQVLREGSFKNLPQSYHSFRETKKEKLPLQCDCLVQ